MNTTVDDKLLKEIKGLEYAAEVIYGKYDNALDLLPYEAIIFGGALRDIAAKLPLKADLDVLCWDSMFGTLNRSFLEDARWCLRTAPDTDGTSKSEAGGSFTGEEELSSGKSTQGNKLAPFLKRIVTYNNVDNEIVQVMVTYRKSCDIPSGLPIALAKEVDFRCCGLIMTRDGLIYEVVPGAYEDCVNRVLVLNTESNIVSAKRTEARIKRLVDRGWTSRVTDKQLSEVASKPVVKEERLGTLSGRITSPSKHAIEVKSAPVFEYREEPYYTPSSPPRSAIPERMRGLSAEPPVRRVFKAPGGIVGKLKGDGIAGTLERFERTASALATPSKAKTVRPSKHLKSYRKELVVDDWAPITESIMGKPVDAEVTDWESFGERTLQVRGKSALHEFTLCEPSTVIERIPEEINFSRIEDVVSNLHEDTSGNSTIEAPPEEAVDPVEISHATLQKPRDEEPSMARQIIDNVAVNSASLAENTVDSEFRKSAERNNMLLGILKDRLAEMKKSPPKRDPIDYESDPFNHWVDYNDDTF